MPADYNIPMTDAQITEALQLMVERVSEGWAQETYDGSPVGSGSPYYHKSSKYWATRSEDAAARAEAAVPAGTAGAVFFDRVQTLTEGQKAQARQNIKAGGSNRNLLNNPFFEVNQRGVNGSVANAAYGLDRWRYVSNGGGSCSMQTGQITIVQRLSNIEQRIEPSVLDAVANKALTASIMFADGTVEAGTATMPAGYTNGQMVMDLILGNAELRLYYGTTYCYLRISPLDASGTITIRAVKLELGSVSTLANDAPPNYAEELARCQRYFVRIKTASQYPYHIGFGVASSTTALRVTIPTPVSMRAMPTSITFSGSLHAYGNGLLKAITSLTGLDYTANGILVSAAASDLAINEVMTLMANSIGTYIDISADL